MCQDMYIRFFDDAIITLPHLSETFSMHYHRDTCGMRLNHVSRTSSCSRCAKGSFPKSTFPSLFAFSRATWFWRQNTRLKRKAVVLSQLVYSRTIGARSYFNGLVADRRWCWMLVPLRNCTTVKIKSGVSGVTATNNRRLLGRVTEPAGISFCDKKNSFLMRKCLDG